MSKKWTPEEDQKIHDLYASNTPGNAIAKLIGRSRQAVYARFRHLGLADPENRQVASKKQRDMESIAYMHGMAHRQKDRPCVPPSRYEPKIRAWWFAGWHDKDMELGKSAIGEVAA